MESKTAVIYARFSCSKQREASIEDQLRVCHEWCRDNGYLVVGEYCDQAMSGRSDNRPEFQRMISNAGESEIVLVYMMDRFSRDVYDAPIYKKRLRDRGVRVVSATEALPDGPESILIESIYEAMAAMESAHISRRVRRGMEGNAMKCMHNGVRVFGYDFGEDGRYVVDEEQAELVREAFRRKAQGESLSSIAKDFARRGVRNSYGRVVGYTTLYHLLRNEKYIGVYEWGETRVEGGMPAIVTEEEFRMAQETPARKRRKEEDWAEYAFSGKGVCMECGHNLVGVSAHGKSGRRYDYYRCSKKCGCKAVRSDWLEPTVASKVRAMLSDSDTALAIAKAVSGAIDDATAKSRAADAQRRVREAEKGVENLLDAVQGGMPYDMVRDRLGRLKLDKARAEADARAWSERSTLDVGKFAEFLSGGVGLPDEALLRAFVSQVQVGADKVVAVLNYDMKKSEPARIEFPRGFEHLVFGGPNAKLYEHHGAFIGYLSGCVFIVMRRAA